MTLFDALIFDMDGTLTRPVLDFGAIRRELGIPQGDIVEAIRSRSAGEQKIAWAVIERHEEDALERQVLQPGCLELLARCRSEGLRLGLVTRNAPRSVAHFCSRYGVTFDGVVTRDFPQMKPHPGPVLHLLKEWNVPSSRALVIGDYIHDVESGRAAGTRTCFFQNPGLAFHGQNADYTVSSMAELENLIFDLDSSGPKRSDGITG
jgi:HAD superfamily hydrolase (TIGR01509 family)